MPDRQRVLILGGTSEAVDLANAVTDRFDITYSLAGRTKVPSIPENATIRTGGFGGVTALSAWMRGHDVALVIDATHPFAEQISANAADACKMTGTPRLRLLRPAWDTVPGDSWHRAEDVADAARLLPLLGRAAFLSVGRQELNAFAGLRAMRFLIRTVDPLKSLPLLRAERIIGRGPFTLEQETALMREHKIDVLVSKNAGGDKTYAKIAAARVLSIPVVMIKRPCFPSGVTVDNIGEALEWLKLREQKTT